MTDREKKIIKTRVTPKELEVIKLECEKQNISIQRFIKNLLGSYFAGPQRNNGAKNNVAGPQYVS